MTYEEMISDLVKLREHPMMPTVFKPTLNAILEYFAYEDEPKITGRISVSERLSSEQENVIFTIYNDHDDTPCEYIMNASTRHRTI